MFTYSTTLEVADFQPPPQENMGDFFTNLYKLFDPKCLCLLHKHRHPSNDGCKLLVCSLLN